MFVIANNITTRDGKVAGIFRQARAAGWNAASGAARELGELARRCAAAGADALEINIQQHFDTPEAMRFAVKAVQPAADLQLCLSANNAAALEAGLKECRQPALANYLSVDEDRLKEMLPAIAKYHAGVVLLVSDPAAPADAREMLEKTAVLVGAANEAGITNDRIMVDPGLVHVTADIGQRHLGEVFEFIRALPDATDPPVRSTCWLANSSTGAPRRLRPAIETALLPMLAGIGLSSVFLDVLQRLNRRAVRLVAIFDNKIVYSDSEIEI
jgi:5-methyltetrahydrofolate corrinoid/iron sulfur protein methyltransferase